MFSKFTLTLLFLSLLTPSITKAQVTVYPNPFADSTTIMLELENNTDTISLMIYNRWGELIIQYFEDTLISGRFDLKFNADTLVDNIYIGILMRNDKSYPFMLYKGLVTFITRQTKISDDLRIFPNPVSNCLNVLSSHTQINKYRLYDLHGRMITFSETNTNKVVIDFSNFDTGMYILELSTGNAKHTQKVWKE